MKPPKHILPVIVIAQFCCTSLWFASNGIINDLILNFNLSDSALGQLTSAVQFGFITGTLIFAILTIADRFSPSRVFFISALLGAAFNVAIIWEGHQLFSLLTLRFLTGFFLAGIYPVGMKIASDYFDKGLGKSLGFLVGALVVGTAFPHLLKQITSEFQWEYVLITTSILAVIGGSLLVVWVKDGPNRKASQRADLSAFFTVFKNNKFRSVAFGYFGHMWELYAFWAFVPVMLQKYIETQSGLAFQTSLLSFIIIAVGGIACVLSGYLSQIVETRRVAFASLFLSGLCCLLFPFIFESASGLIFIAFLIFWGMVVIADSPLLSTLVAQNAPSNLKGTALTIVNCLGFSITIVSILTINTLATRYDSNFVYMILAIGPIFGLMALRKKENS